MENSNLNVKEDSNLNVKEEERPPSSVTYPAMEDTRTTQTNHETESTQTNEEIEPTQMNMSDENEYGAQLSTIEPANLQQGKKPIEAERDRILQALLRFVEAKSDEIFTVKNTEKKKLSDSELKSEPTSRKRGMTIIKIEEPTLPKIAPSNNEVALTFRKRKRKQERPSRAPMGDGLDEILFWAKQVSLRDSSPVEKKKKTKKKKAEKCNFPKFAWSWGRKEVEKDFNKKKPRRRSARKPRDTKNVLVEEDNDEEAALEAREKILGADLNSDDGVASFDLSGHHNDAVDHSRKL